MTITLHFYHAHQPAHSLSWSARVLETTVPTPSVTLQLDKQLEYMYHFDGDIHVRCTYVHWTTKDIDGQNVCIDERLQPSDWNSNNTPINSPAFPGVCK